MASQQPQSVKPGADKASGPPPSLAQLLEHLESANTDPRKAMERLKKLSDNVDYLT